jgi:hypothetical protein
VLNHPQSSIPSLQLLPRSMTLSAMPHLSPTHHETRKCVSPHKIDSRVEPSKFPGFKFQQRQVNYSSQIKPRTTWFLIKETWKLGIRLFFSLPSRFLGMVAPLHLANLDPLVLGDSLRHLKNLDRVLLI